MAVLAVVVVYFSWVAYPPSKHEARSKEILQRAADRFQAEQNIAGNAAVNGYVDPAFRPFWGRKGKDYQDTFPLKARLKALEPYCDLLSDHDLDLEKLVRQNDPRVAAQFEDYAQISADFHKNCSKPNFVVPEDAPPRATTTLPNLIGMRSLALHNSAFAEYLVLKNQPARALQVTADSIRFGSRLNRQQGGLLNMMISVGTQSTGQNTLAMICTTVPVKKLAPELESISKLLVDTHPRRDDFLAGLETEYYAAINIFTDFQSRPADIPALLRMPGQLRRELHLYKNAYLAGLEELRAGRFPSGPPDFNLGAWVTGQSGYLSSMMITDFNRATRQYLLMQKRQAFLHLWVELLRKGHADKRFPADYSQMVTLEGLDRKQIDYTASSNQMTLKMRLSPDEVPQQNLSKDPGMKKWQLLMGTDWQVQGRL